MPRPTILLFDLVGDEGFAGLKRLLSDKNKFHLRYERAASPDAEAVAAQWLTILAQPGVDAVILGCGAGGLELPTRLVRSLAAQKAPPLLVAAFGSCAVEKVEELLGAGASEFLMAPFDGPRVLARLHRLLGPCARTAPSVASLKEKLGLNEFVGEDPGLWRELRKIETSAKMEVPTLLVGETGTGKELCARAIHYLSARSGRPFVPVNCAAIPGELLENELFGHEPGAFTGATRSVMGMVEQTAGSTLFLDELDALSLNAQAKLLRLLQQGEFRPLGSRQINTADLHIIAAMNSSPETAIREGRFRADFFYRFPLIITLPPLRKRRGDIEVLARHFLAKYAAKYAKVGLQLSPTALQTLLLYSWPGNVRQLENVIRQAVLMANRAVLQPEDLPIQTSGTQGGSGSFHELKGAAAVEWEKHFLTAALLASHGNLTRTARLAHLHRRTLQKLLHKHQINPDDSAAKGSLPPGAPSP